MKTIVLELMELGLSEYEAKAYLSLLRESPATAYEIGKSSGIPTSKVYEVLKKLAEKGIISIIEEDKTRQYTPIEPDEFLSKYKNRTEMVIGSLKNELSNIKGKRELSYIWNITEYDYLIDKTRRMIESASKTILVSTWKEEFALIKDRVRDILKKRVKVATVHFGPSDSKLGQIYQHPIGDTIYQEKGGRGFVVVVDSKEVLMGTIFKDNKTEGAWSMNRGFVTLAEDYIKHDIYIMKIVKRFDRTLIKKFGDKYAKLRDIFKDEEVL
ncbi:MAG: TrmB family transcriptional regulator [Thermodesulfovibrionales bacterium]